MKITPDELFERCQEVLVMHGERRCMLKEGEKESNWIDRMIFRLETIEDQHLQAEERAEIAQLCKQLTEERNKK